MDVAGFIPGLGDAADVLNGVISWLRDDLLGAVVSFGCAAFSVFADTLLKPLKWASKSVGEFLYVAGKEIRGLVPGIAGKLQEVIAVIDSAKTFLGNKIAHAINSTIDTIIESIERLIRNYNGPKIAIAGIGSVGDDIIAQGAKEVVEEAGEGAVEKLGKWVDVNESMSDYSRKYQELVTGRTGQAYFVDGVKFDGLKNGVLVEAKAKYSQFIDEDGLFKSWFTGLDEMIKQAKRQLDVANETPIEWYFSEENVAELMGRIFSVEEIDIKCVFYPMR